MRSRGAVLTEQPSPRRPGSTPVQVNPAQPGELGRSFAKILRIRLQSRAEHAGHRTRRGGLLENFTVQEQERFEAEVLQNSLKLQNT